MTRAQSKRRDRILGYDAAVVPVRRCGVKQLLDLAVVVVVKDAVAGGASQELNGQARVFVDGRVLDVCGFGDDIFGALADECARLVVAVVDGVDNGAVYRVPEDGRLRGSHVSNSFPFHDVHCHIVSILGDILPTPLHLQ